MTKSPVKKKSEIIKLLLAYVFFFFSSFLCAEMRRRAQQSPYKVPNNKTVFALSSEETENRREVCVCLVANKKWI